MKKILLSFFSLMFILGIGLGLSQTNIMQMGGGY